MTLSEKVANLFRGADAHVKSERIDEEIRREKQSVINAKQAIVSGARVIESMSSSMRLLVEIERERND